MEVWTVSYYDDKDEDLFHYCNYYQTENAATIRALYLRQFKSFQDVVVNEIEIPLERAELIDWLNENACRIL